MYRSLSVHFLPSLVTPEELAAGDVVVIDVLRASTTITQALAANAESVWPLLEVAEARRAAATLPAGSAVLGGERGGLPIEGFHLGNSPQEYTPEAVAGRTVVFTTTNGTAALNVCRAAHRVFVGAFVNLTAIQAALAGNHPIHLLCAGTRGRITREDVLFAGALTDRLLQDTVDPSALNDQAWIARDAWRAALPDWDRLAKRQSASLAKVLRQTQGGKNLMGVGLERDIDAVSQVDRLTVVGELNMERWRIVVR